MVWPRKAYAKPRPVTPIGINLPNDQAIRERYGSKSVSLSNVIEASDKATPTAFRREFSWTPEEAERASRWSVLGNELLVNMHLHSNRFSVETEMTVKVAKLGARIYEVPIAYHGRTYAEGKKISWSDGVMAVYDLVKYRFRD